jgi:hypothetical protein
LKAAGIDFEYEGFVSLQPFSRRRSRVYCAKRLTLHISLDNLRIDRLELDYRAMSFALPPTLLPLFLSPRFVLIL